MTHQEKIEQVNNAFKNLAEQFNPINLFSEIFSAISEKPKKKKADKVIEKTEAAAEANKESKVENNTKIFLRITINPERKPWWQEAFLFLKRKLKRKPKNNA